MKKLSAVILALVMIVACSVGYAAEDASTVRTTLPLVDEKVSDISMTLLVGPTDLAPNDMWFFRYYADRTNVDWQVTPVLTSDWGEKKAIIMGSGDYTDVYWSVGWTNAEILNYGSTGIFLDLKPYYDYAPDYVAAMDMVSGSWDYVTTPNGANYSLAFVNPVNYYAANGMDLWLRTEYLEANGLDFSDDYIITADELYTTLQAIKNQTDIPMTGMWNKNTVSFRNQFLTGFGFDTNGSYDSIGLLDGQVVFIPTTERYKEFLTYMNKLYTEGLIDQDIFSQDETQLKAKTSEGLTGGWVHTVNFLMDLDRNMQYQIYAMAYDDNTDPIRFQGATVRAGEYVITDACKYPELAMAWINLFYQPEHAFNIMYGPTVFRDQDSGEYTIISEGVTDEEEAIDVAGAIVLDKDGNYVGEDAAVWSEKYADEYTLWDWYAHNKPVNGAYDSTLGEDYIFSQMFNGMPKNYEEQYADNEMRSAAPLGSTDNNEGWWRLNSMRADYKWISHGYPSVYFTDDQQAWLDANQTVITDYVYQMEAQFITGRADINADWDAFQAELEKLGAAQYEQLYVDAFPG